MKRYTCDCCGGTINLVTGKCEYCGTQYEIRNNQVFRIETFQNPVHTIVAAATLEQHDIYALGLENASKIAVEQITQRLAEGLAPFIKVYHNFDIETFHHKFVGELKVVIPSNSNIEECV